MTAADPGGAERQLRGARRAPGVLERHDLVARGDAFAGVHAPSSMAQEVLARRRLVFDELFRLANHPAPFVPVMNLLRSS